MELDIQPRDTVEAIHAEGRQISFDTDLNGTNDFYITCSGQDIAPGPSFAWNATDRLFAYYQDSVGIIGPYTGCSYRSFSPGDTLSPFSQLSVDAILHYTNWLGGGPCGEHYAKWYIGVVRILQGQKHAGVLVIGSYANVSLTTRRYWPERIVMSNCPGEPFIIPE
jgi:hypothetical protein